MTSLAQFIIPIQGYYGPRMSSARLSKSSRGEPRRLAWRKRPPNLRLGLPGNPANRYLSRQIGLTWGIFAKLFQNC